VVRASKVMGVGRDRVDLYFWEGDERLDVCKELRVEIDGFISFFFIGGKGLVCGLFLEFCV
jgi:hypothetical protein